MEIKKIEGFIYVFDTFLVSSSNYYPTNLHISSLCIDGNSPNFAN